MEMDKFELVKRIRIREIPEFYDVCMQFYFALTKNSRDPTSLIFAKKDRLIEFNFECEQIKTIYEFEVPLTKQPEFFQMNDKQTISIVASSDDGVYYNSRLRQFIDIDELFLISNIKEIIHDEEDRVFYLLANKHKEKLGLFMIRFHEDNPQDYKYFMKYKNKLDISDAEIAVNRLENNFKELIVSYKTIYINTYNV